MTQNTNLAKLRRRLIAVEFLELSARKLEEAERDRTRYIRLAKYEYGLSNQTIGEAIGLSEGRVRQMVKALDETCWNCGGVAVTPGLCVDCGSEDGGDK